MYKEPQKEKLSVEVFCDVCGKPVADSKAKSDVTRYLLSESRCQCIHPVTADQIKEDAAKHAAHSQPTRTINLSASKEHPDIWREKFDSALANLPARYQFLSVLGEGGMGCVFKVLDTEQHSLVAIKMLRQQFVHNNDAIQRFKQEAKAARNLEHPNIAKVIGYGIGTEGAPYLVMEFHEGQNLAEMLHGGHPLDPYQAVRLFIQIASAADYAHKHNIIHRDIKPSNIIVERLDNGDEVARLVDFGIAKTILAGPGVTHGLTQTGEIFGSPPYMPPEQCEGKELDPVSDVYAFGCVMYECLTGRTPFQAANPIRMILKHMDEIPEPLSKAAKKPIPQELNNVVMRCLEKDRSKRFASMDMLKLYLEGCLVHIPKPEHIDAPPVVSHKPQHNSDTMFIPPVHTGVHDTNIGHLNADEKEYLRQEYSKRAAAIHNVNIAQDQALEWETSLRVGVIATLLVAAMMIPGILFNAFAPNNHPIMTEQTPASVQNQVAATDRRIYNLASAYYRSGHYKEAATLGQFAYDGFETSQQIDYQSRAATLLSQCYAKMNLPQKAQRFSEIGQGIQQATGHYQNAAVSSHH